jgi:hypothetical protein
VRQPRQGQGALPAQVRRRQIFRGKSMRAWGLHIMLAAVLLSANGCRESGTEDYLVLTGKVFIFNYRVATATYVVTFSKARPIPDGSAVLAVFENPAGGDDLRVEQKVWPKAEKVTLESPPLACVAKGKPYRISVSLFGPDKKLLQKSDSTLTSTLDQSVLPDRPLVVGPVYTPNPDLIGHPDGKLPGLAKTPCP